LSHPPISTAPSAGYERNSSSASIARKLRYMSGLGLEKISAIDIAGISSGKPPACHTPRFTSSTRWRKCWWQGLISLHVFKIAITGLPR
jgi:hypothetical protein